MSDFIFHTPQNTEGETQAVLTQINKAYGFIPSLFGYMAEAPSTLKAYLELNRLLAEETSFSGAQLQVALLAVSIENGCEFCTIAHRAMAKKFSANATTIRSLVEGVDITDKTEKVLVDTIVSIVRNRGWLKEGEMDTFLAAGFTRKQYLELILVVTIKTLSNYINHQTNPVPNEELLAMLDD